MVTTALDNGEAASQSHPVGRIGPYEVRSLLGRGATASVYECCHPTLGHLAAIKVLHPHLTHDGVAVARFLREARVLSRMAHPNVVQVLDVGQHDGMPYIVMSLVDGNDLGEHLARHAPLSVADAADCILPIISAVAAAHDVGIVHRDLKPSNVRMTRDHWGTPCPVVLDFGISKLMAEGQLQELTDTNTVLGTANYMSPEQMRSPKDVDARSDVYALGVILYQCATGKRPFEGANAYDVMHAIMTASVPPPSFFRSEIPKTFDSIVLRAMHRDPLDRFGSAREFGRALSPFASDLAAWSREFAPLPEGESAPYPASSPTRKEIPRAAWLPNVPSEVVGSNADAAVAIRDHYVVLLWRRNVVKEGVEWTRTAFERIVRGQPGRKIVFLTVVESGCEIASSEVRKEIAELLKAYAGQLACAAIVFEESGFRMTILRSIITAINLTSRGRFPNSVFSNIEPALNWIMDRSQPADSAAKFDPIGGGTGSPNDLPELVLLCREAGPSQTALLAVHEGRA